MIDGDLRTRAATGRPLARMILTVHDELLFEAAADRAEEAADVVRDRMENAVKLAENAGRVLDAAVTHPSQDPPWLHRAMPLWLLRRIAERSLSQTAGRPEQYGLARPDHPLLATHHRMH